MGDVALWQLRWRVGIGASRMMLNSSAPLAWASITSSMRIIASRATAACRGSTPQLRRVLASTRRRRPGLRPLPEALVWSTL